MTQQGFVGFLEFCGVEVSNSARTVEYIRNGLAGSAQGKFEVGDGPLCGVLYREPGSCAAPYAYASPALDPAPWWNPLEPASAAFLGLVLTEAPGYDSVIYREATQRVSGLEGGLLGKEKRGPRVWQFKGVLVSASDQGAEYGLRWLTSVLKATSCDECSTCDMRVRLACPPADCSDDTVGEWLCYESALSRGPKDVTPLPGTLGRCRDLVDVEFDLTCGDPYLYKRPEICLPPTVVGAPADCTSICDYLFGPTGDPICCDVATPQLGQTLGAVFSLTSESGMGAVLLEAYEECPGSAGSSAEPVLQLEIRGVPAGGTVVVDCSRREITVTEPDETGLPVASNGDSLVMLPTGRRFDWIEVRDCDLISCLCARTSHPCSQGFDTTVAIQTQAREG